MTKRITLLVTILAMFMLCAACGAQTEETTLPTPTETTLVPTEQTTTPTTVPATEATTEPTTEPATEPTTEPTEPPHVHQLDGLWRLSEYDPWEHQYHCACKEYVNEPHTLDEEGACTVCEVLVRREENGEYVVTRLYDGSNLLSIEQFFKPIAAGNDEFYRYQMIHRYADGVIDVIEYGTHGHTTTHTCYSADGTVAYIETRTYVFDDHGGYELDIFNDGILVEERTYIVGPDGEQHQALWIQWNGDEIGWLVEDEFEFNESGRLIYQRGSQNGVIRTEKFFAYHENGERYTTHEFFYDQNGQLSIEKYYDAKGNQIKTIEYP